MYHSHSHLRLFYNPYEGENQVRNADLIGKVCKCSRGTVGVVLASRKLKWGESWTGLKLDNGNGLWASRKPKIVANSIQEYYLQLERGEVQQ